MSTAFARHALTPLLAVIAAVLASLLGVWLASRAIGFEFKPVLVATVSGSISLVVILMDDLDEELPEIG